MSMTKNNTRLELTWIGKENRPKLEPRILLEDDKEVLKWSKPIKGQFRIDYRFNGDDHEYIPDFAVETHSKKYLCETKRASDMEDPEVLAKASAAVEWCKHATAHELANGGKPWSYLLIPHDVITASKTLKGLAALHTRVLEQ